MGKLITFTCDRCGKAIGEGNSPYSKPINTTLIWAATPKVERQHADLCPGCATTLAALNQRFLANETVDA